MGLEEFIIWIIIIAGILFVVLPYLSRNILPALYWFFAVLSFVIFALFDQLFSAAFIRHAPWVMWMFWGGVIGAALGFWTVAPIYGLRQQRPAIAAAPFALMLVIAIIRLIVMAC